MVQVSVVQSLPSSRNAKPFARMATLNTPPTTLGDAPTDRPTRPVKAYVADVRQLDLGQRRFRTNIPIDKILGQAGLPGTKMAPPGCAMRSR